MAEQCTHDCSSCSQSCSSREQAGPASFLEKPHELSSVKHVVAVASGKGGVGKSFVTSMLAVGLARRGYKTAVLDADITGPSIPKLFGIHEQAQSDGLGIYPALTGQGTQVISINMMLDTETTPVIWRGPVIAGVVKQFWTDVIWRDVDFLFVDMPPGTGDVPLTVFQSLPVDGCLVVSTPQDLVSMIVSKAVNMTSAMHIPVLGLLENMSYLACPDCGKQIELFGHSKAEAVANQFSLPFLGRLPIDPAVAALCDEGRIEEVQLPALDIACDAVEVLMGGEEK
ncbi:MULTISPECIES: Mrp/NBP35 family ATP-binding protein [Eubacteriales]|uniref:Iron-sulfur cluster carrier protein n=1 Tax=Bittarella massiliensis (ex Durand et al. 2017) TaxID=1720313 RepID=A0AAQ1MDC3_9FIRM|nr:MULTISPECIES: Mrp/NBP35 family ATP-binding protein [Eubacteriales]MZL69090.1 P-loop NTPase [Bittarella massiliensis (ex Durand et al. 2017)]MZL79904.1 P-loop NTPase [Bittarella massiliensis (ex Durand et al. 2017)]SHG11823.1 Chromosome partitioning ATPase, Mrp family, contains Fe-S cluster [Bittarella massiliensis (ex Durand et al. 2017)]